jgi:hypothetical protein
VVIIGAGSLWAVLDSDEGSGENGKTSDSFKGTMCRRDESLEDDGREPASIVGGIRWLGKTYNIACGGMWKKFRRGNGTLD